MGAGTILIPRRSISILRAGNWSARAPIAIGEARSRSPKSACRAALEGAADQVCGTEDLGAQLDRRHGFDEVAGVGRDQQPRVATVSCDQLVVRRPADPASSTEQNQRRCLIVAGSAGFENSARWVFIVRDRLGRV